MAKLGVQSFKKGDTVLYYRFFDNKKYNCFVNEDGSHYCVVQGVETIWVIYGLKDDECFGNAPIANLCTTRRILLEKVDPLFKNNDLKGREK